MSRLFLGKVLNVELKAVVWNKINDQSVFILYSKDFTKNNFHVFILLQ